MMQPLAEVDSAIGTIQWVSMAAYAALSSLRRCKIVVETGRRRPITRPYTCYFGCAQTHQVSSLGRSKRAEPNLIALSISAELWRLLVVHWLLWAIPSLNTKSRTSRALSESGAVAIILRHHGRVKATTTITSRVAMAGLNYVTFNQDHSLLAVGTTLSVSLPCPKRVLMRQSNDSRLAHLHHRPV